jgi:hypothetical protein
VGSTGIEKEEEEEEEEEEEIVATAHNRSISINRKRRSSHYLLHQELPPFVPPSPLGAKFCG